MDYERERRMAEAQAKGAIGNKDWQMAAYHLFNASRTTLRLAQQVEGRTRDSLQQLAEQYMRRGDQALRLAPKEKASEGSTGKGAKEEAEGAQRQWFLAERPSVRLEDVAGMAEMKEAIETDITLPMKYTDVYAQYGAQPGSGVLMYGPPGTGKTYIAKAIAGEVDAAFIHVEMDKVLSKWFGETEHLLGSLFEAARSAPRTVIFFDEAEALFPKRGSSNSSVMARVVPQLLQLINGLDPTKNCIILLGATNHPWLMDSAATRPGRFGRLIYCGLPDLAARRAMLEHGLRETPCAELDFDRLAALTEGYSGADLVGEKNSVRKCAIDSAFRRSVEAIERAGDGTRRSQPITMADFESALKIVRPSVNQEEIDKHMKFREKRAGQGPSAEE